MIDAYRHLHGDGGDDDMTWRGARGGKFGHTGMRIDHCIVSRSILHGIEDVQILGRARGREGFMGSDHCPVLISCSDGIQASAKKTTACDTVIDTSKRVDDRAGSEK